jgi:hypothetical protein
MLNLPQETRCSQKFAPTLSFRFFISLLHCSVLPDLVNAPTLYPVMDATAKPKPLPIRLIPGHDQCFSCVTPAAMNQPKYNSFRESNF